MTEEAITSTITRTVTLTRMSNGTSISYETNFMDYIIAATVTLPCPSSTAVNSATNLCRKCTKTKLWTTMLNATLTATPCAKLHQGGTAADARNRNREHHYFRDAVDGNPHQDRSQNTRGDAHNQDRF
ncbi:uncharacterized protein PgNI_10071 [Pyricularia grisea]|uniref:Uncharacterized protein n=1 Tax=Pyricularia grisea TaxID=148305 RepID=A0A6P8ATG5_PYRGI|nr:uncharacterized protein PgNI_10071 [Pyricularia grisea]TLD05377.1 hypothetical protein PgNI_10071 [Pyricularia grisea]